MTPDHELHGSLLKDSVLFILVFTLIQLLLFSPALGFNPEHASFFPSGERNTPLIQSLFFRQSMDLWKCSPALIFLYSILLLSPGSRYFSTVIRTLIYLVFYIFLAYHCYYFFYISIYGDHPFFINDFVLIRDVVPVFLSGTGLGNFKLYLGIAILLALGISISIFLIKKSFELLIRSKNSLITPIFLGCLSSLVLLVLFFIKNEEVRPFHKTVFFTSPLIWKSMNMKGAEKYKQIDGLENYQSAMLLPLETKPNIHFIFIESYGAVAYLSEEMADDFEVTANQVESDLAKNGWLVASAFSKSTVKGGRSWLGFSSALSGLRIENQLQYKDLIEKHPDFPHIVRYLNKQDYFTTRLSTMRSTEVTDSLVPYETINRFWGFDKVMTYNDIPYSGKSYDLFGGIPDQYSISFVADEVLKKRTDPFFFFFITNNSHGPWYTPAPLVDNWRDLNIPPEENEESNMELTGTTIDRYAVSMKYQLNTLTNYISQIENENDIIIIMGDHQPPMLEHYIYGVIDTYAVPVHVVSKNNSFLQSFINVGFKPGVHLDENALLMKHEGFYSLFLRNLLITNGQVETLPNYMSDGLN